MESRHTRHARKNASSQSSATIIEATYVLELVVVFVAALTTDSMAKVSWCQLSNFLEFPVPGEINEALANSRKNVVVVDACSPSAVSTLLLTPMLCGIAVRS